jgi:pyruvate/2-oxoglutarate dehydrogenase complex dihydrolipoamide dehydrogenase (E3) component
VRVDGRAGDLAVVVETGSGAFRLQGSHILVAAGRRPCIESIDPDRAGIAVTPRGISVDARLRTTNRLVFAIGDVIGGPQFTHVAGYHAGIVIRNALFRIPARADHRWVPHVTYTDPELAQVGLTEAEASARGCRFRVVRWPYRECDRAQAERRTDGLAKVIVGRRGRILGAGIAGAAAGELIQLWVLAMHAGLGIGRIATMIAPYPTFGEINKRLAGASFAPSLFGPRTRRLVRLLARLP